MAKYCSNCQRQYTDEATFCSECGIALTAVAETSPQAAPQAYAQPEYQQAYTQTEYQQPAQTYAQTEYQQPQAYSATAYQYAPTADAYPQSTADLYPAVSTGTYFWLNIAMAIPLVGFILSIILTCAPKNRSLKNYARAYLIANLIVIGLAVVGIIISIAITGSAFAMFEGGNSYNYFY